MQKGTSFILNKEKFQVLSYAEFDWGGGFITQEWQVSSDTKIQYLKRERDEEIFISLMEPVKSDELEEVFEYLKINEDPPERLKLKKKEYHLIDSGAGTYCIDGKRPGKNCVMWLLVDKSESEYLQLFQWSNNKFDALIGFSIDEELISGLK